MYNFVYAHLYRGGITKGEISHSLVEKCKGLVSQPNKSIIL